VTTEQFQQNGDPQERTNPKGGWPGDWFLYENGKIKGPLAAKEVFARKNTKGDDGKALLISRKGFSQWYPAQDFAEIFRITEDLKEQRKTAEDAKERAPKSDSAPRLTFENLEPPVEKLKGSAVEPPPPSKRVKPKTIDTKIEGDRDLPRANARKTIPGDQSLAKAGVGSCTPTKGNLLYEYLILRGKLRLGRIRNPIIPLTIGSLTLGLSLVFWSREILDEIALHMASHPMQNKWFTYLACIPIAHLWPLYRLAKGVRAMEQQNKYAKTSVIYAMVLGVLPPLGAAYLQNAVNNHWLLHVKHVLDQKSR
jgi:hypothetical protein